MLGGRLFAMLGPEDSEGRGGGGKRYKRVDDVRPDPFFSFFLSHHFPRIPALILQTLFL
jgi:hypothetical protein